MTTLGIIILAGLGYLKGMGFYSQSKVMETGLIDGKISLCPETPNCVSTTNTDDVHGISPIETTLSFEEVLTVFQENDLDIIAQDDNYAHFTFKSTIMGYVDDIEILKVENKVFIKSASRVGKSDLGANRKRVENLRKALK